MKLYDCYFKNFESREKQTELDIRNNYKYVGKLKSLHKMTVTIITSMGNHGNFLHVLLWQDPGTQTFVAKLHRCVY